MVKNPSVRLAVLVIKSERMVIIDRNVRKWEDKIKAEFGKMVMKIFLASSGSAQCPPQRFCAYCDIPSTV
jgi:hypothetical protein